MTLRLLTNLILFSTSCAQGQAVQRQIMHRLEGTAVLFVYRYQVGQADTKEGQFTTLFPDDSIFYDRGYAIEKDMTIVHVQTEDSLRRSTQPGRLYLIDFNHQRFSLLAMDSGTPILHWQPLSEKKFGIQINFNYYGDERYIEKDTIAEHTSQTIIRYTRDAPGRPENAAVFTIYLEKGPCYPILLSDLEQRFHGRVNKIKIIYPARQGQALITLETVNGSSFPLNRKLIDLIGYYRLPTHS